MSLKTALIGASALAVVAVAAAPSAQAQSATTIYGGGGTLAAKLYRDVFNCYSLNTYGIYASSAGVGAGITYPARENAACTTDLAKTEALAYEPVGSGAGLSAFTTGLPANFGSPASTNSVAFINTASTVAASSTPYPEVEFAGSDAYLTSAQITAASAIDAASGGSPNAIFQIASLATPITLPIGQVSTGNLSTKQVCNVFSGQALVSGNTAAKQQIFVRADGSGTTAIFGLWLSQNCTGTGGQGKSYAFTSANGFGGTSPTWAAAQVGTLSTVTAVSGSGGIASAVASASYAIGYVSPDYVQPIVANAAYPAKVNSAAPTVANVTTHVNAIAIPSTYVNTIGQTLNTESTAPALSTKGYGIAGFTFIDTYGCYSSKFAGGKIGSNAKGNQLKTFLDTLYTNTSFAPQATKIINASGFVAPPTALIKLYTSAGGPLSATGINGTQCPAGRT